MVKYLRDKLALSEKGAKELIKGSIYSALVNISMMIPVGIFIMMLNELLKPILNKGNYTLNLGKYLILIIICVAIMYILQYLQYSALYLSTYTESGERRITLAEKLRKLPLSYFGKKDLSDLTNTIMGDCANLEHAFSHAIPQLFGAVISTIIIVIALLKMDWKMGLSVLWVVPIAFGLIFASKKAQKKSKLRHYKSKRVCAEKIQECFENIQDIKAYNIEKAYLNELDSKLNNAEKAQIKSELIMASCTISAQAILRLGLATVILVGSSLFIKGETSLLTYLIFLITASRLYDPLSGTLCNIAEIFSVEIPIQRMKEINNEKIQGGSEIYDFHRFDIKFDKVDFEYNKDELVLSNVSFVAKQGNVTALVGPSGGGKSTAARLSARFWDATKGKITLGEKDVTTIESETLLKNYAIVFQDVTLFNDTVMENIRLGKKDATDEEVLNAAKIAVCDDFVFKLPKGYQTVIGENGSTLSGGERQRISIARAILKDAPIILLDEATASLDAENETKIQNALTQLIKNKTVIIIAHRLRTVVGADKIVVLDGGTVVEEGTHIELMKKNGLYSHLYKIQQESVDWSL